MKRFDTYQKKVVMRSGLGQSTVAGYLSGARRPEKRELVEKLVRGLLPDDATERVAEQVLHDGLLAAGFSAPPLAPAMSLILEISADYGNDRLDSEAVADLSSEIEDFARVRVERVMRQTQKQEMAA